jgi:hypothetical protein
MTTGAYFSRAANLQRLHEGPLGIYIDLYAYPILGFSVRMRHTPDLPMESAGGDHGLGRRADHVVSAGR